MASTREADGTGSVWRLGMSPRQSAVVAARARDPRPVLAAHRRVKERRDRSRARERAATSAAGASTPSK